VSTAELISYRVEPELAGTLDGATFYRKHGCPRCSNTGYRGRVGIFQYLRMNEELEHLTATKATRDELDAAAKRAGMRTLWDDGLDKVLGGLTSVEELARVVV
jgi:type IV pilus assembly protein PilB